MAQITLNSSGVASNGTLKLQSNGTTDAVTIDTAQNMGLGVTPSAWGRGKAIEVGSIGNGIWSDTGSNDINAFSTNAYLATTTVSTGWRFAYSGYALQYRQTSGQHQWYTSTASGTAGGTVTFTQAMTLDASGRLTVGYTSAANAEKLGTNGTVISTGQSINSFSYDQAGFDYNSSTKEGRFFSTASGGAGFLTFYTASGSERARIDSSGNFGIGTTSPANKLQVNGVIATQRTTDSAAISTISNETGNFVLTAYSGYNTTFVTSGSERARIDSSGNLLVNKTTTSQSTAGTILYGGGSSNAAYFTGAGAQAIYVNRETSDGTVIDIRRAASTVGTISVTASATAYNTSSDYRLKESIQPMTGALAKVSALKPCTYKWKADGSDGEGFIAHELAEVVPQCVTGEKDAVDADGNPVYQGIDTSFLVATLTAAIQELKAEFDAYKASHP